MLWENRPFSPYSLAYHGLTMRSDVLRPVAGTPETTSPPTEESWAERFRRLGLRGLSTTAKSVVEADSSFIVEKCIVSPQAENAWGDSRVRSGIVVGAVQSGKTASMLAVAARLLDRGTDLVVVLAGTRISLWQQTYERLLAQLDGTTLKSGRRRRKLRQFLPKPDAVLGENRASPAEYTNSEKRQLRISLETRRPIIVVIPKQDHHLIACARTIHECIKELPKKKDAPPIHMVVLDDEADDGSVLDVEQAKVMPSRIEMLWTGRGNQSSETAHPRLFATYVAYTATPQANFLQLDSNPLSPRDFCAALRAPAASGGSPASSRQATYTEPLGITSHYFGGEAWYVPPPSLTTSMRFPDRAAFSSDQEHADAVNECAIRMTDDAVRAFLVASALRDLEAQRNGKMSLTEVANQSDLSEADLKRLPSPCGMLVHPASTVDRHWHEARRLVAQANGKPAYAYADAVDWVVNGGGWLSDLEDQPSKWQFWYDDYRDNQEHLDDLPGGAELSPITAVDWQEVADRIRELLPLVKLRVVNSDPDADDRPRYKPVETGPGTWRPPPDLLTIFVSGNVMSRGITLEGLTTSVFSRSSKTPVADTQMQMQRWFGYRGSNAPVLRLFTFKDQLELFAAYHSYDTAMRGEICSAMNDETFNNPRLILQGSQALATAKVPTTRLPLSPGATPSVRLIELEQDDLRKANLQLVEQALRDFEWSPIMVNGDQKGLLMDNAWNLSKAATFLDSLRFSSHDPIIEGDIRYERWAAIERNLDLATEEGPLLRTPGINPQPGAINVRSCPYTIAAYLRLWAAALKRNRIDGMSVTNNPDQPWSLIRASLPSDIPIRVGIRFGRCEPCREGILGELNIRPVERGATASPIGVLNTLWGSRGTSGVYLGDQRFDYHAVNAPPPPSLHSGGAFWRKTHHPALLLIHIVRPTIDAEPHPLGVAVGLSLPHGGPEQFLAKLTAGV